VFKRKFWLDESKLCFSYSSKHEKNCIESCVVHVFNHYGIWINIKTSKRFKNWKNALMEETKRLESLEEEDHLNEIIEVDVPRLKLFEKVNPELHRKFIKDPTYEEKSLEYESRRDELIKLKKSIHTGVQIQCLKGKNKYLRTKNITMEMWSEMRNDEFHFLHQKIRDVKGDIKEQAEQEYLGYIEMNKDINARIDYLENLDEPVNKGYFNDRYIYTKLLVKNFIFSERAEDNEIVSRRIKLKDDEENDGLIDTIYEYKEKLIKKEFEKPDYLGLFFNRYRKRHSEQLKQQLKKLKSKRIDRSIKKEKVKKLNDQINIIKKTKLEDVEVEMETKVRRIFRRRLYYNEKNRFKTRFKRKKTNNVLENNSDKLYYIKQHFVKNVSDWLNKNDHKMTTVLNRVELIELQFLHYMYKGFLFRN
jgi:hypothetical protein